MSGSCVSRMSNNNSTCVNAIETIPLQLQELIVCCPLTCSGALSPEDFVELRETWETMCEKCVKEEYPQRDNICLDNGSYLRNFAGCAECHELDVIGINSRESTEDESGIELVTYKHVCTSCQHIIALHEYTFKVEGEFQVYQMECLLCGSADDERSILPVDPRGPQLM